MIEDQVSTIVKDKKKRKNKKDFRVAPLDYSQN